MDLVNIDIKQNLPKTHVGNWTVKNNKNKLINKP